MIYLFSGDYKKASQKANQLVGALLKKQPNAVFLKINSENFKSQNLDDLIVAQGLFFSKNIILFLRICETEDFAEEIYDKFSEMKTSENIFIFVEENLAKKTFDKFKKVAEKIEELAGIEKEKKERLNVFYLTELFLKKDKKKLWLTYLNFIKEEIPAEEIYGILWWQLKTLLIVKKAENEKAAGLKSFVYNKTKRALGNFKEGEIENLAFTLINLYHNSRRQSADLQIGLEKWILAL